MEYADFYRLETSNRDELLFDNASPCAGAYRSDTIGVFSACEYLLDGGIVDRPTATGDRLLRYKWQNLTSKASYVFGFQSLNHYHRWFNGHEYKSMEEVTQALKLVHYRAPILSILTGEYQAIARAGCLDLIDFLPLTTGLEAFKMDYKLLRHG